MYKDKRAYLAHGPEIYPKAHENPKAFSCISGPIFLESFIQCPCGVVYNLQYALDEITYMSVKWGCLHEILARSPKHS
ncbi:hypothetical protein GmHk_15G044308 [Glycine max]|nr:hypothetical protein GmHk_15G044308 [Glycine max]